MVIFAFFATELRAMKFAFWVWLLSRTLIIVVMSVASPNGLFSSLGNWDGAWYGSIIQHGYEFASDGAKHNVAFFPLFPLLSTALTYLRIPWPLSGALINNVAFLGAVLLTYTYCLRIADQTTARWTTIIMCILPPTLFGVVAYSEGLFLFFSIATLHFAKQHRFSLAGVSAAAAAATRPFGVVLALALVLSLLIKRRSMRDVANASIGLLGAVLFPIFTLLRFGDSLAMLHSQAAWRQTTGFSFLGWIGLYHGVASGSLNDAVSVILLLLGTVCVFHYRQRIGSLAVLYFLLSLTLIMLSGTPLSLGRFLFACIPVVIAIGYFARRFPVAGTCLAVGSLFILVIDAAAFAQFHWVG